MSSVIMGCVEMVDFHWSENERPYRDDILFYSTPF